MPWNAVIQLGISGLVVAAGYKIAMVLIAKWAEGDQARTAAIGEGFKAIAEGHQIVLSTMNQHQTAEINVFNGLAVAIARIDEKLDVAFDLTPVRGTRLEMAIVEASMATKRDTPLPERVERTEREERQAAMRESGTHKTVMDPGGIVERHRKPR